MKTPTIAQMRARINSGHRKVLEAARDGRPLVAMRAGDARGLSTCRSTLIGWGAIGPDNTITDIGHSLLVDKKPDPHANGCPDSPGICECFRGRSS